MDSFAPRTRIAAHDPQPPRLGRLLLCSGFAWLHLGALLGWVATLGASHRLAGPAPWCVAVGAALLGLAESAAQTKDDLVFDSRLELGTGLSLLAMVLVALVMTGPYHSLRAGSLAMAIGIALRLAAILTLGPAFATRARGDLAWVTRGIYRHWRHPSEWGLLCFALGLALCSGHWLLAPPALALVLISVVRVAREEREDQARRPRERSLEPVGLHVEGSSV